jgi:hypothetical protein
LENRLANRVGKIDVFLHALMYSKYPRFLSTSRRGIWQMATMVKDVRIGRICGRKWSRGRYT